MLDKDLVRFHSRVLEVAEARFSASCSGPEAERFVDNLYGEYSEAGKPKPVDEWLTTRMEREFLYVTGPPRWVEDEPSWLFFDGKPMVFVSQTQLPRNEVTENHLTWDEVVYLFGARVAHPHTGYTIEYRTVIQTVGIDGVGTR